MAVFGTIRVVLIVFGFILAIGMVSYPLIILFDRQKEKHLSSKPYTKLSATGKMSESQRIEMLDKWEEEAYDYNSKQKYSASFISDEKAIEAGSNDPNIYNLTTQLCLILDRCENGKKYVEKAIELAPEEPGHLCLLPAFLAKENKFQECIEVYNKALTLNPDRNMKQSIYMGLANAYNRLGDRKQFYDLIMKSIELNHNFSPAWKELAVNLLSDNHLKQALHATNQAVLIDPKDKQAAEILKKVQDAISKSNSP